MKTRSEFIGKIAISIGTSMLMIAIMLRMVSTGLEPANRPQIFTVLRNTSLSLVGLYLCFALVQAYFRAIRYRLIIAAGNEKDVPSVFHTYLVTLCRNMFVDLLPARIGELSYIAMMNRGYNVSGKNCLSSLSISFMFDFIALLFIIIVVIFFQLIHNTVQGWLITASIVLVLLTAFLTVFLFWGIKFSVELFRKFFRRVGENRIVLRILTFMDEFTISLDFVRAAGVFPKVILLSLAVRISKYTGIYCLFEGVVRPSFPVFSDLPVISILTSLLSAEGAASLPVPSFMSFGTYEAGGAFALVLAGFDKAQSVVTMLCIHIWGQLIDYSLGITGLIVFILRFRRRRKTPSPAVGTFRKTLVTATAVFFLLVGLVFLGIQLRSTQKIGALNPPHKGQAVKSTEHDLRRLETATRDLEGFIVWSSNRFGNHDILMLSLPDLKITRLTRHPHVDYFPRISPDGSKIVFSRSHQPWVSQRNLHPWSVYLLDLKTRKERLITPSGNVPTWSKDGHTVYYQRNGEQFVAQDLNTGRETLLFKSGQGSIPAGVVLHTPSFSSNRKAMAVTLRGRKQATAVYEQGGKVRRIGDGCQLSWSPDSSYLYYVDKGGRKQNAFYKVVSNSVGRDLWLDLPGDFSHEYFPKVSPNGSYLVFGACSEGHEHDTADYEIFLWQIGTPSQAAVRVSFHTANDCWPDIYLR